MPAIGLYILGLNVLLSATQNQGFYPTGKPQTFTLSNVPDKTLPEFSYINFVNRGKRSQGPGVLFLATRRSQQNPHMTNSCSPRAAFKRTWHIQEEVAQAMRLFHSQVVNNPLSSLNRVALHRLSVHRRCRFAREILKRYCNVHVQ